MIQRASIEDISRKEFFDKILARGKSWSDIAPAYGVHVRTLRDWVRGRYLPPLDLIQRMSGDYSVPLPSIIEIKDETEQKRFAGKIGARKRYAAHGNPGTAEGRSRGGRSTVTKYDRHLIPQNGFQLRREISKPKTSRQLAEFVGICLGDGGITKYQVSVTLGSEVDAEYVLFVEKLIQQLFGLRPILLKHKGAKAVSVVVSSVALVEYMQSLGLLRGHKINNHINVPLWVQQKNDLLKACIRGLFDTDGCVYIDRQVRSGRVYYYIGITITSYAERLYATILKSLEDFGYHPTSSSRNNIVLRRQDEIDRFFADIGSSNPKHLARYKKFAVLRGGVA